ncbi:MAG: DUF4089 domain-containing protein [Caldimonas sp.]
MSRSGPAMKRNEGEAYVDAAAAVLRLPIAAAHREGVVHYLMLAASMADLVLAVALGVDDEPAPTFAPVVPDEGTEPGPPP